MDFSSTGQARRAIQQPAEQNFAATFIVPSSAHKVVAPRATVITRPTNPPYHSLPRRPDNHHHLSMMSILDPSVQTTVHHAFASSDSMPRSFNRVNSPHIQNINQFAVAPTPSFPPHGYITSSSPVEGNLPYRGQAVTQGQSSASTLNYPLSSPSNYLQINAAVPAMAEHANAFSYSAPAGTPDNGTQVTSSVTMWPPHAYPAPDPCHNSNDLRNALYYNPTEASTASRPYDIPAMGNNSRLPFSPQMQSSNTRTPDGLQQSSASYYPGADVFRSQPNVPTTSTSQPGRSHGNHLNHPSYQPPLRSFHGENPHEGSMHNSSRSHTQQSRTCCWLHENNVLCGFEGSMDALKAHFVNSHLSGPQDAQITCLWNPCHYSRRGKPEIHTMRRDSAWRHVLEKHLLVKYRKKA